MVSGQSAIKLVNICLVLSPWLGLAFLPPFPTWREGIHGHLALITVRPVSIGTSFCLVSSESQFPGGLGFPYLPLADQGSL